jgi:hypothetical protein
VIQSSANLRRAAATLAAFAFFLCITPAVAGAQTTPAPDAATPEVKTKAPKQIKAKPPVKSYEERRREDGVYAQGASWLSFRFGWTKRAEDLSGSGLVGYGVGYQRMLRRNYAFAARIDHDIVGHYGGDVDISVPFTGEFQRHFGGKASARPYLGLGGGYYYRKAYRTGLEYTTTVTSGVHISAGIISPVSERNVVGFDLRMAFVDGREGVNNPTFGTSQATETLWSAKVSWALVY